MRPSGDMSSSIWNSRHNWKLARRRVAVARTAYRANAIRLLLSSFEQLSTVEPFTRYKSDRLCVAVLDYQDYHYYSR